MEQLLQDQSGDESVQSQLSEIFKELVELYSLALNKVSTAARRVLAALAHDLTVDLLNAEITLFHILHLQTKLFYIAEIKQDLLPQVIVLADDVSESVCNQNVIRSLI